MSDGNTIKPMNASAAQNSAPPSTFSVPMRSPTKPPPMPPIGRIHSFSDAMKPAATIDMPTPFCCRYGEML